MAGRLRVGCPMWANPAWPGRYFRTEAASPLAGYAEVFSAVEGNTTFYATPKLELTQRWAAQTPADFRFACKLPQEVTHRRRLADSAEPLADHFRALEPLGERGELVMIQLPPSFGPDELNRLDTFLDELPSGYRYAVEVRHEAFFDHGRDEDRLVAVLARRNVEQVVLDTRMLYSRPAGSPPEIREQQTKPALPVRFRALTDHPIVRIIGTDDEQETIAAWQDWLPVVEAWLAEGRNPTVFLHTPENLDTPAFARRFHDEMAQRCDGLAPLVDPLTPSLFP